MVEKAMMSIEEVINIINTYADRFEISKLDNGTLHLNWMILHDTRLPMNSNGEIIIYDDWIFGTVVSLIYKDKVLASYRTRDKKLKKLYKYLEERFKSTEENKLEKLKQQLKSELDETRRVNSKNNKEIRSD